MKTRMLGCLLAICLVIGLLPGMALAADRKDFADVSASAWYDDAVQYAYDYGLMYGTSATTFSPDTTMTRGMIVTILYRLEGSPKVSGTAFDDVAADAYYADAATWAVQNEIVNGCGDKTFCPDSPITREQMAAVLYRYAQFKGEDVSALADLSGYADVASVSEYALTAMQWANKAGLITGTSSTTLSPQGSATRAEAAMILYRFCTDVLGENGIHKVVFDLNYNGAGEIRLSPLPMVRN